MNDCCALKVIPLDLLIPKPEAKADFKTLRWGVRRGEEALIYTIPNHKGKKPYEKGITVSEWDASLSILKSSGEFSRSWFNKSLPKCATEGGCNFTTIGGLFIHLEIATYGTRGKYFLISKK